MFFPPFLSFIYRSVDFYYVMCIFPQPVGRGVRGVGRRSNALSALSDKRSEERGARLAFGAMKAL